MKTSAPNVLPTGCWNRRVPVHVTPIATAQEFQYHHDPSRLSFRCRRAAACSTCSRVCLPKHMRTTLGRRGHCRKAFPGADRGIIEGHPRPARRTDTHPDRWRFGALAFFALQCFGFARSAEGWSRSRLWPALRSGSSRRTIFRRKTLKECCLAEGETPAWFLQEPPGAGGRSRLCRRLFAEQYRDDVPDSFPIAAAASAGLRICSREDRSISSPCDFAANSLPHDARSAVYALCTMLREWLRSRWKAAARRFGGR